jgi:hypothetical protein
LRPHEELERFQHRDICTLSPAQAWAERELLGARLADLIFQRETGRLATVEESLPVYEREWIAERLKRLGRSVTRKAG